MSYEDCRRHGDLDAARRGGEFPSLIDPSRSIVIPSAWDSLPSALQALNDQYRNHRTDGQRYQIWMASEKQAMVSLMRSWFGNDYGIPVIALKDQSSTPYNEAIMAAVEDDGRPAILLYAGDHDPAGLCPSGGVKEFGRRFPRRSASLKEGTHVRVEEDIACAAVAGRD